MCAHLITSKVFLTDQHFLTDVVLALLYYSRLRGAEVGIKKL